MYNFYRSIQVRFFALLFAGIAPAAVIKVPADQPTIQAGINAAENGDTVLVSSATYIEQINFNGKSITVRSASGPKVTIIDGAQNGSVASFTSGESASAILGGFTLQNGSGTFDGGLTEGGGIEISGASPTIIGNLITQNQACDGAGISVAHGGSPLIEGNDILSNSNLNCDGLGGGGISMLGAESPRILANKISGNSQCCADGGGIYINGTTGEPVIENNLISENTSGGSGGGIVAYNQSDVDVIQNVISGNSAASGGGVYWSVPENDRGPLLVNNTVAYNTLTQTCPLCQGSALYIGGFYQQSMAYNNLFIASADETALYCDTTYGAPLPVLEANDAFSSGAAGFAGGCVSDLNIGENISEAPQFVAGSKAMFQLQPSSPAVNAGDNSAPDLPTKDITGQPRIVGGTVDMGAYELQSPTP